TFAVGRVAIPAVRQETRAGARRMVAHEGGRQYTPVGARVGDRAVEWQSTAGRDGGRLEKAGLRRCQVYVVIPRQPGGRIAKDHRAMLLQRDQVLQRIHPRLETCGNEAREHATDVGAVVRGVEETVFPLANGQLQRPLHDIILEWRTLNL